VQIGPDLTFLSVSTPSSAVAGATISVGTAVRNSGAAEAPASIVRFYLSTKRDKSGHLL
jgi:subtilase family serine protease